MTRATTFKQSEITRAVKGVQNAGVEVARVEIDVSGNIVVFAGRAEGSNLTSMDQLAEDFE